MSSYRLRSHIRHCQFGPRTICLDLAASRYFLLEGAAAAHLTDFVEGAACGATIGHLLHLGIIEPGAREHAQPKAAFPTASALDCQPAAPSTWQLYRSILEQRRVRRALTRHSLGSLLEPTGLPRAEPDQCRAVAAAFARASRYRDATDQCLVRSLAMRAMLARAGAGVDLVIGVMLPFAAHCWIQAGPVVLSDPLDHVLNFTPLLTAQ
ncbi:lasso peptide biosynthesis B2 protein [Sphingopyxis chilensis]